MPGISPFLDPGSRTKPDSLALVHLSRDNLQPVYLKKDAGAVNGYAEGSVINTRFGSFPHSTLLDVPWGSQVRASIVDTGSRGRKRKLQAIKDGDSGTNDTEENEKPETANIQTAASGFVHVLPPTPELWTTSLPHRTQVVYTPDYSYILHRIRARPGMSIIEAGAGSGSFTHASARAVFNGYPNTPEEKKGRVFSFEFDQSRYEKMQEEVGAHNLDGIVKLTHRDVYNGGFLLDGTSPEAESIFLDLPAPWKALPLLSRSRPKNHPSFEQGDNSLLNNPDEPWISPLRADRSAYLCTFSPCIEQVTRTVEVMRRLGWMEIEMVEIRHRRINVMRERIGLNMPAERGANLTPANVEEALGRLKKVESRFQDYQARTSTTATTTTKGGEDQDMPDVENDDDDNEDEDTPENPTNGATEEIDEEQDESSPSSSSSSSKLKPWMLGRLIHRTESELKTHTSYLVFAVLPQEWTEEQESAAAEKWPTTGNEKKVIGSLDKETRKQEKREMLKGKKKRKKEATAAAAAAAAGPATGAAEL